MKKLFNTLTLATLVIMLASGSAGAQNQSEIASVSLAHPMADKDKAGQATSGNETIDSRFNALLPTATDQKWTVSKDNFWVSFQNEGKNGRGSFTRDGNMNYIITDCSIEQLPQSFRASLTKDYASYTIFNAIEIKTTESVAYQVVIENANRFITLKYSAAGVEEVQQVKKTK